jgi:hypothetical protein
MAWLEEYLDAEYVVVIARAGVRERLEVGQRAQHVTGRTKLERLDVRRG